MATKCANLDIGTRRMTQLAERTQKTRCVHCVQVVGTGVTGASRMHPPVLNGNLELVLSPDFPLAPSVPLIDNASVFFWQVLSIATWPFA